MRGLRGLSEVVVFGLLMIAMFACEPEPTAPGITPTPTATTLSTLSPIPPSKLSTFPTKTPTPEPIPTPTATTAPTLSTTATPELIPTPTATPMPTDAIVATPTLLPTLHPKEKAMERLGGMLSWFESPPDQSHATASLLITDIWLRDAYVGDAVAQMPWVIDGIAQEEIAALRVIDEFSLTDPELGKGLVDSLWVADGLNNDEFERVDETLRFIASNDSDLAVLLVTIPWAADGLDDAEWHAFQDLVIMGRDHRELTRLLATSSWVADGASLERPSMSLILSHFLQIAWKDSEAARLAATAPWVVDGVSNGEARIIGFVSYYLDRHPEESKALLDFPQAVEGQLGDDQLLYDLVPIAFWNRPAALTVARYANSSTEDMGKYLTKSLTRFTEHDLDLFNQLTEQPWFADGLDGSEAALVSTLFDTFRKSRPLFDDLLEAHYAQHSTVSLPLAGNVNVWVVQNAPSPPGEDLLKTIEDTARIAEKFLGTPFPTTDIILLVVTPGEKDYRIGGGHIGSHMVLRRFLGEVNNVPHETAHYYFYFNFGQVWFREGAAQFVQAYVNDRTGVQSLADHSAELSIETERSCINAGTENIRHFSYELEHVYEGRFWPGGCGYILGENFLLNVYYTLGAESMSAALKELFSYNQDYLLFQGGSVQPPIEEDIYDAFLKHTPPDRREAFRDLYRRLHGGPYAFPDTDFSDEHGDEPEAASTISAGEVVEGALDYMFDFDYFRFQAEEGQKYRMTVGHRSLGMSSVTLYGPDGLTEEKWNWKSRRLALSGPQILWVAPGSEDYYFAVQNFGGKLGPYTLTITKVDDAADDHGDTLATATYASLGEVVQGNVDDDFDFDYFRFRVEAGRQYQISVRGETLEYFRIRLYTSDGAAPDDWSRNQYRDDSASGGMTEWTAPSSGEYYLALDGYHEKLGAYTLTITRIDS